MFAEDDGGTVSNTVDLRRATVPSQKAEVLTIGLDSRAEDDQSAQAALNFQRRMEERKRLMEEKKMAKAAQAQEQEWRMNRAEEDQSKPVKVEKTKEELAAIRKEMMKRRPTTAAPQRGQSHDGHSKKQKEHPQAALMSRLATGTKAGVSKKDMLALTNKNYGNLPEVKKKREEEQKKEDQRRRLQQVKDLEKQRRQSMRR